MSKRPKQDEPSPAFVELELQVTRDPTGGGLVPIVYIPEEPRAGGEAKVSDKPPRPARKPRGK